MRRFIVVGQKALASPEFSLDDLPGTSGRLDVLLRCLRAALLVSHGVRSDTVVYLVLLGGPRAPRTIRVDGRSAEYVRPDERSLAVTIEKALARPAGSNGFGSPVRGVAVAEGGVDAVIADLGPFTPYVLDERAEDVRGASLDLRRARSLRGRSPRLRRVDARLAESPRGSGHRRRPDERARGRRHRRHGQRDGPARGSTAVIERPELSERHRRRGHEEAEDAEDGHHPGGHELPHPQEGRDEAAGEGQ